MSNSIFKYVFKYIIVGNPSVGKSCILNQFLNNKFIEEYEVTVGVEFGAKTIELKDQTRVKLQIWDTAGQESFKSITRNYYRSAAVGIIVYDVTSRLSFEKIEEWLNECKSNGNKELSLVLVGNKTDLESEREVSFNEGKEFAKNNDMIFFESSAKTADNVNEIFSESANIVNKKIIDCIIDPDSDSYGVKTGTMFTKSQTRFKQGIKVEKKKKNCC